MPTYLVITEEVPAWFEMPCIPCQLLGISSRATVTVKATSGLGLASCTSHEQATRQVMRTLDSYDLTGMRTSFVTALLAPQSV
ncbi:hypothetical protein ACPCUF_00885 [Streptomyces griseoincarnatus]